MLDELIAALRPPWSIPMAVAVALVVLLPFILVLNQAMVAPLGRCNFMLRRVGSSLAYRRVPGRTLLQIGLVVLAALGSLTVAIPMMSRATMRPASEARDLLRLFRKPVGPYQVTVLTDRSPIRVGVVKFSVMVERPGGEIVRDAQVVLFATATDADASDETSQSTTKGARGQFSYVAPLLLRQPGRWGLEIQVSGPEGYGSVTLEVVVSPPTIFGQSADAARWRWPGDRLIA